jgi:DNA polymerase-4
MAARADGSRIILHVDMDAFFAAVEQHDRPELRGKPVVVGAPPDRRGVVAACSYEARQYGIRSAMPSREAGRRCPHAVFLPVNGARYEQVSRQVFHILERFTPLVEPLSIDEAFLDVTGAVRMFGPGPRIATAIREAIRRETGLTASVGVAPNKFLAKLGSEIGKPDGLTVVPETPAEILRFLAPLPVSRLWGVGKVTQGRLESRGFRTVGDVQAAPLSRLAEAVGRREAEWLRALAEGRDEREIELDSERKRISREYTFDEDCRDPETLEATLCDLAEDVGRQLRAAGRYAAVGHLKLRWQGFETIVRQAPLPASCCDDVTLREAALRLFRRERLAKPVRLLGFGVSRLSAHVPGRQLRLFETRPDDLQRRERLSRAVDRLREKFGDDAIRRGVGRARHP